MDGKRRTRKAKASSNLHRTDFGPLLFNLKFSLSTLTQNFVERLNNRKHAEAHVGSCMGCSLFVEEEGAGLIHAHTYATE